MTWLWWCGAVVAVLASGLVSATHGLVDTASRRAGVTGVDVGLAQTNGSVAFHTFDVTQSGCTLSHTVAHVLVEFGAPVKVVRESGMGMDALDGAINTDEHNAYGLTVVECGGVGDSSSSTSTRSSSSSNPSSGGPLVVLPSHPDTPKARRVFPDFVVPRLHAGLFPSTRLGDALRGSPPVGSLAAQYRYEAQIVMDVATAGECPRRLRSLVRSLSAHAGAARTAGDALASGGCMLRFLDKDDQTWQPTGQLETHGRKPQAVVGGVPLVPAPSQFLHATTQDAATEAGATDVHTLNMAQGMWRDYLKAADAFARVASGASSGDPSEDDTAFLEQSPLMLLEEDNGQCNPDSFVEVDAKGMIPGLSALLDPIIEAVMAPVNAILGGVLGATLGAALSNMLGKSINEGLTNEVTALLTNSVVPALTESLVPVLTETVSDQVTHHFSASLRDEVVKRVVASLTHSLTKSVTQELSESVPQSLEATLPDKLGDCLSRTLTSILTRSVSQSVVPALTNTLFHSPQMDYYCSLCKTHQRYCELCVRAPKQLAQAEYYAAYYSSYFSGFFANSVSKKKERLSIT